MAGYTAEPKPGAPIVLQAPRNTPSPGSAGAGSAEQDTPLLPGAEPANPPGRRDGSGGIRRLPAPRTGPEPPVPGNPRGHRTAPRAFTGQTPAPTDCAPPVTTLPHAHHPHRYPRSRGCPRETAPAGSAPLTCSLAGVPGGGPLPTLPPHTSAHGGTQRQRRSAWGRAGAAPDSRARHRAAAPPGSEHRGRPAAGDTRRRAPPPQVCM